MLFWLIIGIAVGVGLFWMIQHSRRPEVTTTWYGWVLGVLALLFALLAIEVFAGSMAESEPRAAWLGLLAFAVPAAILGILAWLLPAKVAGKGSDTPTQEQAAA